MKHEISTATNQHSVTPSTKMMEHPVVAHEASRSSTGNSTTETPVTTNSAVTVEQWVDSLAHIGTRSGFPNVLVFLLSDALSIGLTLLSVRFIMQLCGFIDEMTLTSFRLMMGFYGLVLIAGWYQGLYSTVVIRPAAEMRVILLTSLGLAALFGILPMVIQLQQPESLAWLTCGALMLSLSQPALRAGSRMLFGRMPWWGRRVLLVGCGDRSASIYRMLKQSSVYGLRPVGFVEDYEALGAGDKDGYLGPTAELAERVAEHDVNLALVATGGSAPRPEILNLVYQPNSAIGEWLIVADGMGGLPCLWTAAREVAGMPALGVANRLSSPWRRHLKRAIDLSIVLAVLPLWLPMLGLLALIIRLTSPGKAFYSQQRLGLGSKTFRCWKLRSMVQNADEVLHEHLAKHPELLEEWKRDHKLKKDPRITWIGSFLRKTSLDELPQLFNVLKGDMSLVGPRPIVYAEIEKYGDVYKRYELVVPGITGLWQVNGRNNTSYEDRLAYDDYYVKNWSLSLDFYIMFCTIKVVLLREGAY
jgi:Undecaprenyl-phosphate galactose phosphotransferase WbaP